MKLKSVAAAALGAALLCLTAGCSITDIGKEDLLRPPKTMGDVGKSYFLKKISAYQSITIFSLIRG